MTYRDFMAEIIISRNEKEIAKMIMEIQAAELLIEKRVSQIRELSKQNRELKGRS